MLIGAHHVEPTLAGNVSWKRPIPADIGHMVTAGTLILNQKSSIDFFSLPSHGKGKKDKNGAMVDRLCGPPELLRERWTYLVGHG